MSEQSDIEYLVKRVAKIVREFLVARKIGNIQINCFDGGISNINKTESIKLNK